MNLYNEKDTSKIIINRKKRQIHSCLMDHLFGGSLCSLLFLWISTTSYLPPIIVIVFSDIIHQIILVRKCLLNLLNSFQSNEFKFKIMHLV